jgi:hypothetical protein
MALIVYVVDEVMVGVTLSPSSHTDPVSTHADHDAVKVLSEPVKPAITPVATTSPPVTMVLPLYSSSTVLASLARVSEACIVPDGVQEEPVQKLVADSEP